MSNDSRRFFRLDNSLALLLSTLAAPALAQTLPTGADIVHGSGSVAVNGNAMTVTQGSARMVADWQGFSIGAANAVQFVQPSANAVALNRVIGGDPSTILGSLSANGHVYLQNPNGVLFAPGAQVSVGSLVATSLSVDLPAFLDGRLQLAGDASRGSVRNAGSVVTTEGGHVVLVAPQVANSGHITTPGGTAALVAGSAVRIDPTGAGLLDISVPQAVVNARLEQSGRIEADGGAVRLATAAVDAALGTVMQVGGVVRARRIEQRGGEIVLAGGASGVVRVDGVLDASGHDAAAGGTLKVLGERVALLGQARLDASGGQGGGTVLVGGNYQGQGAEPNARDTHVGAGVRIDANATRRGDGGTVVVWSDNATAYAGRIAARGGAQGGDGGLVEVSGRQTLAFDGEVDVRAPHGRTGELLLDPDRIEIGVVADLNNDGTPGDDLIGPDILFDGSTAPSFITAARVAQLLATGDVTLQATTSIDLTAPLTVAPGGADATLTLNSASIGIGQPMVLNNASLVIDNGPVAGSHSIFVAADISSLASISLATPELFLDGSLTARDVRLSTREPGGSISAHVSQDSGTGITADTLTLEQLPGSFMSIQLGGQNRIGSLVLANAVPTVINIVNPPGTPLAIRGSVDSLFLSATSGIVQSGALQVASLFDLTTTDTGATTGVVDLSHPANSFGGSVNFSVASHFSLAASGALSIAGSAGGNITLNAGGPLSMFGNLQSAGLFGPSVVDINAAGVHDGQLQILLPAGGRFRVRSSDFSADSLLGIGPSFDYIAYNGASNDPGMGNGFYTNRTASITGSASGAPAVSHTYDGGTDFAFVHTLAGGMLEEAGGGASYSLDDHSVATTLSFADKNAGIDKGYTVAADPNASATSSGGRSFYGVNYTGYVRLPGEGSVSEITPRAITAGGITAVDRVYDGSTLVGLSAAGATLSGVIAGDVVSLDASGAVGLMADKHVGTAKPVTVADLALAGADAGNYNVADASAATVNITPRALTTTGLAAIDRVYDGTTLVAADASGAVLAGAIVPDDIVTLAGASGQMADKHVGIDKPVTLSVLLAGADAGNYSVVDASNTRVTITPRTVLSTGLAGVDRAYDGSVAVAIDASAASFVNAVAGDSIALDLSGASGTMADKHAGAGKPVTIAGVTLTGTDAANYSHADASDATVTISPRTLTATGIGAANRVVDGSTAVTLATGGVSLLGLLPGDVVGVDASGAVGLVPSPAAGVQPVSISGLLLTGPDAANYSLASAALGPRGEPLQVRLMTPAQAAFEEVRYRQYLQGVSDAQEPFRRAMAEALAAGFGKENIRRQLSRGLVFETGLAAPAVDEIDSAARPDACDGADTGLACGR